MAAAVAAGAAGTTPSVDMIISRYDAALFLTCFGHTMQCKRHTIVSAFCA